MGAGLWPASAAAHGVEPLPLRLALLIISAVTVFFAASFVFAKDHLIELRDLINHARKGLR
jgi:hypothetical protein